MRQELQKKVPLRHLLDLLQRYEIFLNNASVWTMCFDGQTQDENYFCWYATTA